MEPKELSRVVFEYAGLIGREQDRDALIGVIANMGRDLVQADRCTIWLIDEGSQRLITRFAHGSVIAPLGIRQGFVGHCAATGETILSNSPATDPLFASAVDERTGYRTTSILTVPMRASDGRVMGAVQALNKPQGFDTSDAELLALAANYSARTIETQRLLQQAEAARRVARDLEIAREVQQRLLAASQAQLVDGVDFSAVCRPAFEVGGDYFDLLPMPTGEVAIAVGDISGKGIAAALMMASVQATLHGLILQNRGTLADLVRRLSRSIFEASTGHYSTLVLALYDPKTRVLAAVNAGHCHPLVLRTDAADELSAGGPPIGLLPDADYEEQRIRFEPGDTLICYSDGLSEARDPSGAMWDDCGLRTALLAAAGLPASEAAGSIMRAADAFAAGAVQHDDMTIACLRPTS